MPWSDPKPEAETDTMSSEAETKHTTYAGCTRLAETRLAQKLLN